VNKVFAAEMVYPEQGERFAIPVADIQRMQWGRPDGTAATRFFLCAASARKEVDSCLHTTGSGLLADGVIVRHKGLAPARHREFGQRGSETNG